MNKFGGVCNLTGLKSPEYYFKNTNTFSKDNCIFTNYTKDVFTLNVEGHIYSILFLGNIYNYKKLMNNYGWQLSDMSQEEFILRCYIENKLSDLHEFNGGFSFAIWDDYNKELFFARDHMGVKPFYYSISNNTLYMSSSLDELLNFKSIDKILDTQSINELFGLGPAHTPGTCLFKNVYELRPAHFGIFNKSGLHIDKYWELQSRKHTDDFETTCDKISYLLEDSINQEMPNTSDFCTMLSGGLDSSIITAYASKFCKRNNLPNLKTISVDYVDNDKNFVKSDFQPNSDNYYIDIMRKAFNTEHKTILIDTPELAESLKEAMDARALPGMADIDSSLLLFCKAIKKDFNIAISGECSDEVFSGYPWFFREDALDSNTFPWSLALNERQEILNPAIADKISIKDYVDFRYNESLDEINFDKNDSIDTVLRKRITHLTYDWFMQTLVDRAERIANSTDLEVLVPFCDYRLVEYLWNIPWEIKAYKGREKGLLRYIVKDLLPTEIVDRKKSPYPKTHNPTYLNSVKVMLTDILNNSNSPALNLINKDFVQNIIDTDGKSFTRPWFGQLMTGPQLMAYLIQINMWLQKYQPKLEI